MKRITLPLLAVWVVGLPAAWAQTNARSPHLGYLYPAGGQRGVTVDILAGGQYLGGAAQADITGEGVTAKVVKYFRPVRNLNGDQRRELQRMLRELRAIRVAEMRGETPPEKPKPAAEKKTPDNPRAKLPDHPLLLNMEEKSLRELIHISDEFFVNVRKRQPNAQIAESVLLRVTIDPEAPPGDRELRLRTPRGLTNAMCFQVSALPEANEQEPNGPIDYLRLRNLPPADVVSVPVVLNGQVEPGDVDRFRLQMQAGQRLLIRAQARHLVPFLADAVPGWFQAVIALYDQDGNEVTFGDEYEFHPDPVLFFEVPKTGVYELEIRDAIYRGREDFVYRIAVGELPFVTSVFPLGGRQGEKVEASVKGWNLPTDRVALDTSTDGNWVRQTTVSSDLGPSNPIKYAVDSLPEVVEQEPNDADKSAQRIKLPVIINGRIDQPGDVDLFRFRVNAAVDVVAEVCARRLGSPIDSLVRVMDGDGRVLAWNDDYVDKEGHLHRDMGYITHHADSYVRCSLESPGIYTVQLSDAQRHGGEAYAYRLRISQPRPDFRLLIAPSSITIAAGRSTPITAYVLRKDGYDGPVEIAMRDGPAGFRVDGGLIPSGRNDIRMTLTAPPKRINGSFPVQLEGRGQTERGAIVRIAEPCDNVMQAFLWRHLAPAQQCEVAMTGGRFVSAPMELASASPVRVPRDGSAQVEFKTARRLAMTKAHLELQDPPEGIELQKVTASPNSLTFLVKADGKAPDAGYVDNLIVEVYADMPWGKKNAKGQRALRRVSLGVLPAVPFEVVAQ